MKSKYLLRNLYTLIKLNKEIVEVTNYGPPNLYFLIIKTI